MLKYTFGLVCQGDNVLLLNRAFPGWMGCWNGVGGKIEANETPRESMLRELQEETQLVDVDVTFKGLITWSTEQGEQFGGMYVYVIPLADEVVYPTPVKMEEGILDWKSTDWILHPDNVGVAANLPYCLEKVLHDAQCYHHHSIFRQKQVIDQVSTLVDAKLEYDEAVREAYIHTFIQNLDQTLADWFVQRTV